MNQARKLYLLGAVFLFILAAPVFLIWQNQSLRNETESVYRFRIRPIDPWDMMRGRYVRLDFDNWIKVDGTQGFRRGSTVYVSVESDSGYAYLASVSTTIPEGKAYFETQVRSTYNSEVRVEIPFERYYLNEELAPVAEEKYAELAENESLPFVAEVVIKNGKSLLREVYVGDTPLPEYLRSLPQEAQE